MTLQDPPLALIEPPDQPLPLVRLLRTVVANPLRAWHRALYQRPIYRWRLLGHEVVYVMAPDLVRAVLQDDGDSFQKGRVVRQAFRPVIGESILAAERPRWRWQRRAVASIFRHEQLRSFFPAMIASAERTRDRWRALSRGSEVDIAREMMRTTFDIIVDTTLSGREGIDLELVEQTLANYLRSTPWIMALAMIGAPDWTPYPGKFRTRRAIAGVHRTLDRLIAEETQKGIVRNDLLFLLMNATDPETGQSMSPVEVRNNLLTFITAGHETTALALTWTLYLLSLHPQIEQRVRQEIASVTAGERLRDEHIDAVIYTHRVLQEAMRLYPPAPLLVRETQSDVTLGDERLRAGTMICLPVYAIHRHESLWSAPDRFDPDRFAVVPDRYSYLPFGAGPRVCIGSAFALREAVIVLATLLSSFRLRLRPTHRPEPQLRAMLRPAGGMPMRIEHAAHPTGLAT